jgi:V8-like Glu-specific endopeptidase
MPWGAKYMIKSFVKSLSLSFLLISNASHAGLFDVTDELIYGNDDRYEIDLFSNQSLIEKSQSVAIRVSKRRLSVDRTDETKINFPFITLERSMPEICKDERFIEQISLGTCSGFLVGPKTLVTAGHCMVNQSECADNRWVFGFKVDSKDLNVDQVYSCKKIISQRYVYTEKEMNDYAVIELDRDVVGYKPLKLRKFGRVLLNTPLVVIGHPLGLPMKATDGAVVSRMNDIERENPIRSLILRSHYFTANLDSYGGNSGSPVFNARNGQVEGILVQGADDFVYDHKNDCMKSRKLSDHHLETYEKVMRINKVPGL